MTSGPINYLSVIVVLAVQVESVFLLRQFFLTIPRELEEAAKIDGAGYFTTFCPGDPASRHTGARGRGDPPVPGRLEQLLLAL